MRIDLLILLILMTKRRVDYLKMKDVIVIFIKTAKDVVRVTSTVYKLKLKTYITEKKLKNCAIKIQ